jgi:hypothetical protein
LSEWSKQQQLCCVALGKKKREKSEEKEKKEWSVGPRKWASQGWTEQGKTCH